MRTHTHLYNTVIRSSGGSPLPRRTICHVSQLSFSHSQSFNLNPPVALVLPWIRLPKFSLTHKLDHLGVIWDDYSQGQSCGHRSCSSLEPGLGTLAVALRLPISALHQS